MEPDVGAMDAWTAADAPTATDVAVVDAFAGTDAFVAGSDAGSDAGPRLPYVRQLALGQTSSCALLWSGAIRCWGSNDWGELGDGSTSPSSTPTTVTTIGDAIQISVGGGSAAYACAVRADHTVWCWGANGLGMLGYPDGSAHPMSTSPTAVPGVPATVVEVEAGWTAACARRSDALVSCWGYNGEGELDDGTTMPRTGPVIASAHDPLGLAAGYDVGCAWFPTSAICWGSNANGEHGLGDGSSAPSVMGLVDPIQVSVNEQSVCALHASGAVSCWGANEHGQLGDNTTMLRTGPVAVMGLTSVVRVATGWTTNCALLASGTIECWGGNVFGEFGSAASASHVPVAVSGVSGALLLAMGERHVCMADTSGVWCWGANERGQAGATPSTSTTPHRVPGL